MIAYLNILQTGIQSLLAVACGWGCGRWSVLQPDPTVAQVNTMVLKFCLPCLQVWLLAIKTDMRQPGSWSALLAFLTWSVGLQVLLALAQLLRQGRLNYVQLGVDSLLLTTNNTGILGPVVLMAALGPDYAALGMLATVALYFQQLPSAQLLFQLHKESAAAAAAAPVAAAPSPVTSNGHGTQQQWQGEGDPQEQQSLLATAPAVCAHGRISSEAGGSGGSSLPHEEVAARHGSASAQALAKPGQDRQSSSSLVANLLLKSHRPAGASLR
ncbi:hypothetical protein COO60DRAFT_788713 [Scenedesmus sp. NREL 46B-D3]|nr:hypothetical protein COO60DRAFT_788713 [Scenedesmus sp. NREL 46B-D3]